MRAGMSYPIHRGESFLSEDRLAAVEIAIFAQVYSNS